MTIKPMIVCLFFALALGNPSFEDFMAKHEKVYRTKEERSKRESIFNANLKLIER